MNLPGGLVVEAALFVNVMVCNCCSMYMYQGFRVHH